MRSFLFFMLGVIVGSAASYYYLKRVVMATLRTIWRER
jgi:hypothetical protein